MVGYSFLHWITLQTTLLVREYWTLKNFVLNSKNELCCFGTNSIEILVFTPEIFVNDSNWSSSARSPTPKFTIVSHDFYLQHHPCLHCQQNHITNTICMSICMMSPLKRKTFENSLMIGGLPSFPSLIS